MGKIGTVSNEDGIISIYTCARNIIGRNKSI